MIFAELTEKTSTKQVLSALSRKYTNIEWGDQGTEETPDAYFWIKNNETKVSVDNFTSMNFMVKCDSPDVTLIQEVIEVLSNFFEVRVYEEPELEAHED